MNRFFVQRDSCYIKPCHVSRSTDVPDSMYRGVVVNYNAMGHLLKRYDYESSGWKKDVGDYFAVLVLEACWLLCSQGKEE